MGVMGSLHVHDGVAIWVWWGHGVLTVCSLYHGAVKYSVLWSHDIGAAVLWIMINECQVYGVGTIGHRVIILVLYDGQTAALVSKGHHTP